MPILSRISAGILCAVLLGDNSAVARRVRDQTLLEHGTTAKSGGANEALRKDGQQPQAEDTDGNQAPNKDLPYKPDKITDPSGGMEKGEDSLSGGWTPMSTWKKMWHPYIALFWLHVILASGATVASLYYPRPLLVVMACSGLLWPISAITGQMLWDEHHKPLTADWWMTFIKWLIVDAAAGLPVLACKAFDFSKTTVIYIGIGIYVILGANIVWTFLYTVDGWVRMWNTFIGGVLTLSLSINCFAQAWHGKALLEVINGFPYGRGTTLPWLISYTIWNALFVADFSMGMTLQDILFWAMMYAYQSTDSNPLTVEYYFAFARPVQLGVYIACGCWCGLVPAFRDAIPLAKHVPLHVNEHAYFLFICTANFCLAVYTLGRAIQLMIKGPEAAPVVKRLTQVSQ